QRQVALLAVRQARPAVAGASGDRDDAAAGGELLVEDRPSMLRELAAPVQDELGRALDDHLAPAARPVDERGGEPALVVERARREPRESGEIGGAARLPQRLVERVAAHDAAVADDGVVTQQPRTKDV